MNKPKQNGLGVEVVRHRRPTWRVPRGRDRKQCLGDEGKIRKASFAQESMFLCRISSAGQSVWFTPIRSTVRICYPVPLQGATAQICNKFMLSAQCTSMVSVAQRKSAGLWLRRSRFQNSSLTPYAGVAQRPMALVSKTSVRKHHVGSNPNHPCHHLQFKKKISPRCEDVNGYPPSPDEPILIE